MEPLSWRAEFPREVIRLMMVKGPLRQLGDIKGWIRKFLIKKQ